MSNRSYIVAASLLLLLLFPIQLFGGNLKVDDLYSIEDGLSQTHVNCLLQDEEGFLWVGTKDGLNRFDGYQFVTYRHQPGDTTSISNDDIRALCQGDSGVLWIGTAMGLNKYVKSKDVFYQYYPFEEHYSSERNMIYAVIKGRKGFIWINTIKGLYQFDPRKETFVYHSHYSDPFTYVQQGHRFSSLLQDEEGKIWVSTKDGLNFFDPHLGLFKRFHHNERIPSSISNNRVKALYKDRQAEMWIGTANGLNLYKSQDHTFKHFYPGQNEEQNTIIEIAEDHRGRLWLGTRDGVIRLSKDRNRVVRHEGFYSQNRMYRNTLITSIIEDHSQVLWLGTNKGLMKLDTKPGKFKLYRKSFDDVPDFSSNNISAILKHNDGTLWLGTDGGGLNVFNRNTNEVVHYTAGHKSSKRRLASNIITSIYKDSYHSIWLGTPNGINIIPPSGRVKNLNTVVPSLSKDIFKNNRVFDIQEGPGKDIWLATNRGLHRYLRDSGAVRSYYELKDQEDTIQVDHVYEIAKTIEDSGLWIGTSDGVVKYQLNTQSCEVYQKSTNIYRGKGLSGRSAYSLCVSDSITWIGTAYGLHKLDKQTGNIQVFSEKQGLPNNMIYAIEQDRKGRIWVSTNKGLARLHPGTKQIQAYDVADGLQNYNFNLGASYKGQDGELFFGGPSGLNAFYPDSFPENQHKPNIVITSFKLVDHNNKVKKINVQSGMNITIPPKINMFTIRFAALDFVAPVQNRYAYKMFQEDQGDKNWIQIQNKRQVTFTNLSPGDYTFRVKGSNNDGIWNNQGTSISISVEPPFWKTRLAYYVYGAVLLMLIIWIFRLRTKTLRKSNKSLREKERAIEKQKEELSVKNRDITSSLTYAERIQEAMLPSLETFKQKFTDSFVLFKPKHIVSGDFYWINESYGRINVAAVDCTGHGVPGAFMSLIGIELLRRVTNIRGLQQPAQILNVLNEYFAKLFEDVSTGTFRDGMDIAFCSVDKANHIIEFAGAFNPLYIIRNDKIIDIPGNRLSIGLNDEYIEEGKKPEFDNQRVEYQEGDVMYIFTDGYADQFGGPENKKYKKRRLRHLLLNIYKEPLETQKQILEERFENWRSGNEQVDDVLIIGLKP